MSPVSVCLVGPVGDVFVSRLLPGSEMQPAGAAAAGAIQSKHQAAPAAAPAVRRRLDFFGLFILSVSIRFTPFRTVFRKDTRRKFTHELCAGSL